MIIIMTRKTFGSSIKDQLCKRKVDCIKCGQFRPQFLVITPFVAQPKSENKNTKIWANLQKGSNSCFEKIDLKTKFKEMPRL